MNDPRTAREALLLQALSEVDALLARVDGVETRLNEGLERLDAGVDRLLSAGTKYTGEVAALTVDTKAALTEFIQRRATATTATSIAEARQAMQEAATLAFADRLEPRLHDIAQQLDRQRRSGLLTLLPSAALAGAALIFLVGIGTGIAVAIASRP